MIVRSLCAALVAGILVGAAMVPVQYARVVPLILHAETFESGEGETHDHASVLVGRASAATATGRAVAPFAGSDRAASGAPVILAHSVGEHGEVEAVVENRLLGTLLSNLVTGGGFALMLLSASLLLNRPITRSNGLFWGLAGFGVVALAPALGLPPELPAMPAAELGARQAWWILTALATAGGLGLLVLQNRTALRAAGVALVALPHLVGAPHPADIASPVPATLAAEFAVASLGLSALLWTATGALLGRGLDRARRGAAVPA